MKSDSNATTTFTSEFVSSMAEIPSARRKSLKSVVISPLVCSVCASFGIFGGISSIFAGLLCIITHIALTTDTMFEKVGTVLMIAGIPLLLMGSIFLDEIESKNK